MLYSLVKLAIHSYTRISLHGTGTVDPVISATTNEDGEHMVMLWKMLPLVSCAMYHLRKRIILSEHLRTVLMQWG